MVELPSPCLVVLVGPAGVGKSTWARANLAEHVVAADALRALVGEGEHDLRASADAFALLDIAVAARLRRRLTTVIDSLGSDPARRSRWRQIAHDADVPCVAIVLDAPAAQIRRRNRTRVGRVPDAVLRRQLVEWPAVVATVEGEPFADVHHLDASDVPAPRVPDESFADRTHADAAEVAGQSVADARIGRGDSPNATSDASVDTKFAAERIDASPAITNAAPAAVEPPAVALVAPVLATRPSAAQPPVVAGRALRFGLQLPRFAWPGGPALLGERLREVARRAEAAGFDSLWVMDHFRQIPQVGPAWEDMPESWTTLAHLAACTARLRLGTLVTGITYRNVAHLGKIVATLDVLSGGRAECGLGLGWFEAEHRAYGWPFPSRDERYALLADALALLPRLWGPGAKPFDGRVLHVPDTSCYPRPLQAKVPILVGGSGERRTLRLVAEHADACNLFGEPDVVAHKVAVLRRHCADVGRDPADVSVSHLGTVLVGDDAAHVAALVERTKPPRSSAERHARAVHAGTVAQHVARVGRYVDAGVDHVIVSLVDVADPGALERYGQVIAASRHHP